MAAGLISEADFVNQIKNMVELSKMYLDNWEIRKSPNGGKEFLYKKVISGRKRTDDDDDDDDKSPDDELSTVTVEEENDPSCHASTIPHEIRTYEYHIVYSSSYSVPVLYFNVYKEDGKLISLENIWKLVPDVYQQELQVDKWSILTQQEHPLLGRPFYQLHPCHTEMMMKNIQTMLDKKCNYLVSWISSVGPVVGLNLPLQYAASQTS